MKRIEQVRIILVAVLFGGLFAVVLAMIVASQIWDKNESNNSIIKYLLKNVTIQTTVPDDRWALEYPYETTFIKDYERKVNELENVLDSYCTVSFPESESINNFVSYIKRDILNYKIDDITGVYENIEYVQQAAMNVIDFEKDLRTEGYPFLYVQTPSIGSIKYYSGEELSGDELMLAERNYALMSLLQEEGINTINIARDYGEEVTFDSSKHWYPKDGLKCAYIISEYLNESYNFNFDTNVYMEDNFYDYLTNYPEAKNAILNNCGYDYEFLVPMREYNYMVTFAEKEIYKGKFNDVMIRPQEEWNLVGQAYHTMLRITNNTIWDIKNYSTQNNKGRKLLIIGDSFNWAVSTYLSLDVENIVVIHNASFTGSIMSYVRAFDPDIVIMVYNDAEFYETFTEEAYYLK